MTSIPDLQGASRFDSILRAGNVVAQASSPASLRTVPVQGCGGETPPELAGGDACATSQLQ